jgi:peptidoglycan/LPS O-acetylase OafA/YrhL
MAIGTKIPSSLWESRGPVGRLAFLDGLRGIAALAVCLLHFYPLGPFYPALAPLFPGPLNLIVGLSYWGVPVFFVLSGFVMAYSQRNAAINARYLGNFALRRSLRLDPPYWVALAIALAITWLQLRHGGGATTTMPSDITVLRHLFYLQGMSMRIIPVGWTLCYEVQFYLFFTMICGVGQWLSRQLAERGRVVPPLHITLALFAPVTVVSLCCALAGNAPSGLFVDLWYIFFLGAVCCWSLQRRLPSQWFWICLAVAVAVLCGPARVYPLAAIATGTLIYFVGKTGKLTTLLGNRLIQFFGRISYSIYLLHGVIGVRILTVGYRITGDARAAAFGWLALASAVTVGSSWLLYTFVERPGVEWGKRLKHRPPRHELATRFVVSTVPACADA